jgi:hypothetical protein
MTDSGYCRSQISYYERQLNSLETKLKDLQEDEQKLIGLRTMLNSAIDSVNNGVGFVGKAKYDISNSLGGNKRIENEAQCTSIINSGKELSASLTTANTNAEDFCKLIKAQIEVCKDRITNCLSDINYWKRRLRESVEEK